jgi:hypothetical protein
MDLAVIIAVALVVASVCYIEVTGTDPRNQFFFALLDRLVSDESRLDPPDATSRTANSQHARHAA